MTERDQFEEVAELHGLDTRMLGESRAYMAQTTRVGWALWQESRKQALEEAAQAVDQLRDDHCASTQIDPTPEFHCYTNSPECELVTAWNDASGAIRDLATKARTLKKESA